MASQQQRISKSAAKARFLLTDADLRGLAFTEKPNPQHRDWAPMRMYSFAEVEAAALAKHGSLDAVEAQKQARVAAKLDARAKKRAAEAAAEARQARELASLQAKAAEVRAAHAGSGQQQPAQAQQHEEEETDPATGRKLKRFAADLAAVEVEEL